MILIRYLAVADMMNCVPKSFTSVLGLVLKRWVLGSFMCAYSRVNCTITAIVSMFLICALNVNKTMSLKFPLKSRLKTKKQGRIIAVCVWVFAVISTVLCGVLTKMTFNFRRNIMHCADMAEYQTIKELLYAAYLLIPVVSIVSTTLWLLRFVQKARGLNVKGSITLLSVSIVFIVSWAPYGVHNCIMSISSDNFKRNNVVFLAGFEMIGTYITFVKFSSNPLIYYLSVSSFNKFVTRIVSKGQVEAHQSSST